MVFCRVDRIKPPADGRVNGLREVMQDVALAGLYRGGFFDRAAFYGVILNEEIGNFVVGQKTLSHSESARSGVCV